MGYRAAALSSPSATSAAANFVFTTPGATALTRTPGPSCQASSSVSRISAAFEAPYAAITPVDRRPATLAMLTTDPPCSPIHAR